MLACCVWRIGFLENLLAFCKGMERNFMPLDNKCRCDCFLVQLLYKNIYMIWNFLFFFRKKAL